MFSQYSPSQYSYKKLYEQLTVERGFKLLRSLQKISALLCRVHSSVDLKYCKTMIVQQCLCGTTWAYNSMYHKKIATFVTLTVGNVPSVFLKESFNNYMDKKRGERIFRKYMLCHQTKSGHHLKCPQLSIQGSGGD